METQRAVEAAAARLAEPLHGSWDETEYAFTLPFSLTGQPAVTLPWTRSAQGQPIGVQLAARKWRDDLVIAAARAGAAEFGKVNKSGVDFFPP